MQAHSPVPSAPSRLFRRLSGYWDYLFLWGLLLIGVYLVRPRPGASVEEYGLFAIWNVLLLCLCARLFRPHRDEPVHPTAR